MLRDEFVNINILIQIKLKINLEILYQVIESFNEDITEVFINGLSDFEVFFAKYLIINIFQNKIKIKVV